MYYAQLPLREEQEAERLLIERAEAKANRKRNLKKLKGIGKKLGKAGLMGLLGDATSGIRADDKELVNKKAGTVGSRRQAQAKERKQKKSAIALFSGQNPTPKSAADLGKKFGGKWKKKRKMAW